MTTADLFDRLGIKPRRTTPAPHGPAAAMLSQQREPYTTRGNIETQLRETGMSESEVSFHREQGPPQIPVEQQPDFIDSKSEWLQRFGHQFAEHTDPEYVFHTTGGRNLDRMVTPQQIQERRRELDGDPEDRNALQRFGRSFASSVLPYAAEQVSGHARHLRERERDPGAASFVGNIAGSIAQFAPSFFSPVILGATIADHAREKADATYAETGDPDAAIGSGLIQGIAELIGFRVAGQVFGSAAAANIGQAVMQGNTRAAVRALGNIAAGSGSVAGIEGIALVLDEMQQARIVEDRSMAEAWQRIGEQLPDRLIGGAIGGALLSGMGAGARGIQGIRFRRAINQRIDAAGDALRTGTIRGEGGAARRLTPEQRAEIREGLNRYAKEMDAQGYPAIAARARAAAEPTAARPTTRPAETAAQRPATRTTAETTVPAKRHQTQPQRAEAMRSELHGKTYRDLKAEAAEKGINPNQSKPALVDAIVAKAEAERAKITERTEKRATPSPDELAGNQRRVETFSERLQTARKIDAGIRSQAVRLVKENLPVAERGKVLTQIRDARTLATLRNAIQRAVKVLADAQHKAAATDLQKVLRKANKMKFRPEYAKHIKEVAGDIDIKGMSPRTRALLEGTAKFLEGNPDAPVPEYVIRQVARLDQKNLADMTAEEISVVTDAVKLAMHLNKTKNRLIGKRRHQKRKTVANKAIEEMVARVPELTRKTDRKTGLEKAPKRNLASVFLLEGGTRPEVILEHLSPTLQEIVWEDITVQAHHAELSRQWQFRDAMTDTVQRVSGFEIGTKHFEMWRQQPIELRTPEGPVQLTRDEAIWMLTTIKDPSNLSLMYRNGATLERSDRTFTVDETTIENLNAVTGAGEKQIADFLHQQFNGPLKKALNDAWVEVFGHEVARVPSYVPRKIDMDRADTGKDPLSELNQDRHATLTSWGNLRDRVGSAAPLELGSALDTYLNHSEHVARIAAYLAPTQNAYALLGRREIKQAIIERLGKQGYNRILASISQQTVRVADKSDAERWTRNRLRLFGAGVLGIRLGPILLNPTGLTVSASYQDGGFANLRKALSTGVKPAEWKRISELATKHSPYWRTRYEQFVRQATSGMVSETHRTYGRPDIAELGLVPLQKSDQWGATIRWRMAELHIARTQPDLKQGSDAYYEQVAREWERLMFRGENTAHGGDMTGVLAFGRQHIWFSPLVMFTSSVSKIYSAAARSVLAAQRAHRYEKAGDKKAAARERSNAARALAGFIGAATLASLVRELQSTLRRPGDSEETITQRLALRLATEIGGYVPVFGDTAIAPAIRALAGKPAPVFSASVTDETLQRIGSTSVDLASGALSAFTGELDADGDSVAVSKLLRAAEGGIELGATLRGIPYSGTKDVIRMFNNLLRDADPDLRRELRKLTSDADLTGERRQVWRAVRLNDARAFRKAVEAMHAKDTVPTETQILGVVNGRYAYLSRYENGKGELTPELRELVNQHLLERDAMREAATLLIYQNEDLIELRRTRGTGRPKP